MVNLTDFNNKLNLFFEGIIVSIMKMISKLLLLFCRDVRFDMLFEVKNIHKLKVRENKNMDSKNEE